jgi:hypothetical protein
MRDDGARKRDSLIPGVLGEPLVQDALVRPVLVEDDQLLALLGDDATLNRQTVPNSRSALC